MPDFMRENSPAIVLGIAVLMVASIFIGADLLNAVVGYHSVNPPEPLPTTSLTATQPILNEKRLNRSMKLLMHREGDDLDLEAIKEEQKNAEKSSEAKKVPQESDSTETTTDEADNYSVSPGTFAKSSISNPTNAELQGVVMGEGVSLAVVELNGIAYTVSTGEKVGKYSVETISQDEVVLSDGGKKYSLRLSGQDNLSSSSPKTIGNYPPVLPNPDNVPMPPSPVPLAQSGNYQEPVSNINAKSKTPPTPSLVEMYNNREEEVEKKAENPNALSRKEMDAFLDKGAALVRDVRAETVPGDGVGVKLEFRTNDNALSKLGLKDGDIVARINQKTILSSEELYNACLKLKDSPYVTIEFSRNGVYQSVYHEFP